MMIIQAAREAVILLIAAVAIGLAVYALRPDKIQGPSAASVTGEMASAVEGKGLSVLSVDEAFDLYQGENVVFADARHAIDYTAGHIEGAVNLTVAESASWISDFLAATDPATVIITYCDGENCHLAPELAELLFFNGFDHVFYLENGWTRWRERGYPVE